MSALVYDDFAVDYDVGDAEGELLGVFSGGGGFDGLGVEDGDVGLVSVTEETPGLQAQALRGERGHLAYCFGELELLFSANVFGEDDGEAAVGAGAGELAHQDGVAPDHPARMRDELRQGVSIGSHPHDAQVKAVVL